MKIKETVERECCQDQDLRPCETNGLDKGRHDKAFMFCVHCGQIWVVARHGDTAGKCPIAIEKYMVYPF